MHEGDQPKKEGEGTIAQILIAQIGPRKPGNTNGNEIRAGRFIIAAAGSLKPEELHAAHAYDIDAAICGSGYSHSTRTNTAAATVRLLKGLARNQGAKDISALISRHPGLRPRNVTATEEEKQRIFAVAPPHLYLFTLFCSDLAIRSGTAIRLGPEHYDQRAATLTLTTKMGERMTLPVTDEIKQFIAKCNLQKPQSFVRQLHEGQPGSDKLAPRPTRYNGTIGTSFRLLLHRIGITRKLTPHDFRRTTAVHMYEETKDVREVQALLGHKNLQSTYWYLDHDARPIKRTTLELIKSPEWRKEQAG